MAGFGETLQQARAHKNVTLREAESETRINRHHLAALEAQNFEAMPPPIYSRGIVRKYADYLGLDASKMLDMYRELADPRGVNSAAAATPIPPTSTQLPTHWAPNFAFIAFGVVLTAIVFAWGYSILSSPPTGDELSLAATSTTTVATQQSESTRPTPPVAPTAEAQPTLEPTAVQVGGDNQSGDIEQTTPRTGLAVMVTADAEITVTVDGQVVFQDTLRAGESTDMFGGTDFVITSSNDDVTYLKNSCDVTSAHPLSGYGGSPYSISASEGSCPAPN